ncbi:DEAD/DEAH box helicase [Motilimonas sp. 1_MG-2023]|uniref:DEAD/DEAH box helicase n=1 Tax=Motilimonas sp. 1_MG-2023 TaxID=3062672 RepID=UPI0026E48FA8|nr:DEAD/DEAH box helicase [Motilimonas sp. 1_MG-2023]MDO6527622.1 DEAD/DEAH box helicase [Motilimonas sp. 1_MG-2023]
MTFSTFKLAPQLVAALPTHLVQASPIQRLTIPVALNGEDVLAIAPTGSGKTFAFGLPLLNGIDGQLNAVQGLIIVPTRELALQIAEQLNPIANALSLRIQTLFGGQSQSRQEQIDTLALSPQIIIATVGRLDDFHRHQLICFTELKLLVLDEGDRLLDMGFWPKLKQLLQAMPTRRQTLLFSATMPAPLEALAQTILTTPKHLRISAAELLAPKIEEQLFLVNKGSKAQALIALLKAQSKQQVLVFISVKDSVDAVTKKLVKAGINAAALHGDKDQEVRTNTLLDFKTGKVEVLVATDLLARGIDLVALPTVINLDLPSHAETYVHRIGRTARAGASGLAISLVCHGESGYLHAIRQLTGRALPTQTLAGFVVTDQPSSATPKRAPRDKQANRRSLNKRSIKGFQSKSKKS